MSYCKKHNFCLVVILFTFIIYAQDNNILEARPVDVINFSSDNINSGLKYTSEAVLSFYVPNPIGSGFAKESMDGTLGFDLSLKYFLLEKWFLNLGFTQEYYQIKNQELVGIYDSTTKLDLYLGAGYFHTWNSKLNSSFELGGGYTQNKNRQKSRNNVPSLESGTFRDTGTLLYTQARLGYQFMESLNVALTINYQFSFMNIATSQDQADFFNDAQYLTARLGLTYAIDRNVRRYTPKDEIYKNELESRNYDNLSIKEKRALYFLRRGKGTDTNGILKDENDQKKYQRLKSLKSEEMTIKQKRELYFLEKKLRRQQRRNKKTDRINNY